MAVASAITTACSGSPRSRATAATVAALPACSGVTVKEVPARSQAASGGASGNCTRPNQCSTDTAPQPSSPRASTPATAATTRRPTRTFNPAVPVAGAGMPECALGPRGAVGPATVLLRNSGQSFACSSVVRMQRRVQLHPGGARPGLQGAGEAVAPEQQAGPAGQLGGL